MNSKKVPRWIRDIIEYTQRINCADTRNYYLNELIEGNFSVGELKKIQKILIKHNINNKRLIEI